MRKFIQFVGFCGFLLFSTAPTYAADVISLFAEAKKSTGALYKQHDDGSLQFLCSVTAIGKHEGATVLLTAYHCVNRGVSYRVTVDGENYKAARVWKIPGYAIDSEKFPRGYSEPRVDMAMFLSDTLDVPVSKVSEAGGRLSEGTPLAMMGFPLGQAKIAYSGQVAGYFDRPGNDNDGYQLLQIFGAPGSSGSAVRDATTGEIVSVLVSAVQGGAGLPVIFATPIDYSRYLKEVPTGKEKEVGAE